jgi:7-alpha-hydroxysteroid dehydrogenase
LLQRAPPTRCRPLNDPTKGQIDMNTQDFSLEGKVALITGSGRGIGAGIARAFARAGASIVLVARTQSELDAVAAEIREAGGRATTIATDITDIAGLPAVIDRAVAAFGGLDVLVNNAGGGFSTPFVDVRVEQLEALFRLEVSVPFELSRLALPHLLARPGACIINTVSPGAYKAPRGFLTHYVVKAALAQLTRLMAADLGPRIRVNAIVPGAVETPALKQVLDSQGPGFREAITNQVRLRKLSTPDDIGRATVFLASPAAAFTTGALLDLTGGHVDEMMAMYPDL